METLGSFSIKRPDVVDETIDGETVIVNLENGVYYSLRNSGVDVWNFIENGGNLDEITEFILGRYNGSAEEIKKAIAALLIQLQQEGLVQVSSAQRSKGQQNQAAPNGDKIMFEPPVLEKYSDMQELLLLDPIHEVDEEGWPNKADDSNLTDAG